MSKSHDQDSKTPTPPSVVLGPESPRKRSLKTTDPSPAQNSSARISPGKQALKDAPLSPVIDGKVSDGPRAMGRVPQISTTTPAGKRLSQKAGEKSPTVTKRVSQIADANAVSSSLSSMGSNQSSEKSLEGKMSPAPSVSKQPPSPLILKFSVPSIGVQKALRFFSDDGVWHIKKTLMEKIGSEIQEFLNYGLFLPGSQGKQGKFLDEKRAIGHYNCENQVSTLLIT